MLSLSLQMKSDNAEITNAIDSAKQTVEKYADVQDFVNIRPIIGVNGETRLDITVNGLVAAILEKTIFLGGYCSTLPATSITLRPNSTNYIYVSRDKDNRHKLNIDNRNIVIGVEGQTSFDRFMPAKFVTDSNGVTQSIFYDI